MTPYLFRYYRLLNSYFSIHYYCLVWFFLFVNIFIFVTIVDRNIDFYTKICFVIFFWYANISMFTCTVMTNSNSSIKIINSWLLAIQFHVHFFNENSLNIKKKTFLNLWIYRRKAGCKLMIGKNAICKIWVRVSDTYNNALILVLLHF